MNAGNFGATDQGVEIDTAKLARVAVAPTYKWRWPGARYADGSVADY